MINYLSKFLLRLSELAELIRKLSNYKVAFNWGPEHQAAFQWINKEISCPPMWESSSYLLIVDYTSRFPAVCEISLMTGLHRANHCKQIFSEYGWPETLIFENGLCYTLQAFTSFMQSYSVNHITSSQYYLQSNDLAEKYVLIVKSLFCKPKKKAKIFTSV